MNTRQYPKSDRKAIKRIQRSPFYQSERKRRLDLSALADRQLDAIERMALEASALASKNSLLKEQNDRLVKQCDNLAKLLNAKKAS